MADNNQPTPQDKARAARHAGFKNSIAHLPDDKRNKLQQKYEKQDALRERNVNAFVNQIRGGK